jgi:hypothetical protein
MKQELNQLEEQEAIDASPYFLFSYSIRSPYTKETYFRRLRQFFDTISVVRNKFEDRCNLFAEKGKQNPAWAFNSILRYTVAERTCRKKGNNSGYLTKLC